MRLCVNTVLVAMLLAGAALSSPAQDIVSFDVMAGIPGVDPNTMDPINDFAGAPGVRTNQWNLISTNLSFTQGYTNNLTDVIMPAGTITNAAGQVVPGMQVWMHPGSGVSNPDRNSSAVGGDAKMQSDVFDPTSGNTNNGTLNYGFIDFNNIPYKNYNIYCYTLTAEAGNGSSGTRGGFWLITNTPSGYQRIYSRSQSNDVANTQIPALTVANATNGGYIRATTASIPPGGTTWSSINGGNYGEFTGLTNSHTRVWFGPLGATSVTDDLGNTVTGGSSAPRFKQAGYQIQQVILNTPTNIAFLSPVWTNLLVGNPATVSVMVESQNADGSSNDITGQIGMAYSSGNTNIFTVSSIGIISPRLQAGTTNLVAKYTGSWGTLSATQAVSVLAPTSLTPTVDKTLLYIGQNGVIDFTKPHLFAGYKDPVLTNVEVTSFNGITIGNSTPATISLSNGLITATAVGNFGINGSYGGLNAILNPAGSVQYFVPVGNPGISVKLTDQLPPSSHAMNFTALSGVPGGTANTDVSGLGVRLPYWNNLVTPSVVGISSSQLSAPLDSGGNVLSNVVIQFSAVTSDGGTTRPSVPLITTNESQAWGTYWDLGVNHNANLTPNPGGITASNTGYIIFSNVPYAHYDVYCYLYNDNSGGNDSGAERVGEFSIGGVTKYRINDPAALPTYGPTSDGSAGYAEATDSNPPNGVPTSINDGNLTVGNFVRFTDVTNSTLVVNFAAMASDIISLAAVDPRLRLVGFQIVEALDGLTATNIYLSPVSVPALFVNGAPYDLAVHADFSDGTQNGIITTLPGIAFASANANIFTVDARGVITPGASTGTANLTVNYTNSTDSSVVTAVVPITTQASVSTAPFAMTVTEGIGNIQLSWPGDHKGWRLVTNSFGLAATNAWFTYVGIDTTTVTNVSVPIGRTGNVYFRLTYP